MININLNCCLLINWFTTHTLIKADPIADPISMRKISIYISKSISSVDFCQVSSVVFCRVCFSSRRCLDLWIHDLGRLAPEIGVFTVRGHQLDEIASFYLRSVVTIWCIWWSIPRNVQQRLASCRLHVGRFRLGTRSDQTRKCLAVAAIVLTFGAEFH